MDGLENQAGGGSNKVEGSLKPYYEHAGVTIYHGDCREILPQLGRFDLLLTDPPYGIGRDGSKHSTSKHGGRKPYIFKGWDAQIPSEETFRAMFEATRHQVIWGGNYFAPYLPPSMGWLFWDKGQRICGSDGELAFTSFQCALRVEVCNRVELMTDGAFHPTQKPLKVIRWSLRHAMKQAKIASVVDPFMGSGTSLVAAKEAEIRAVGIELEEEFCERAAIRLSQNSLFAEVL